MLSLKVLCRVTRSRPSIFYGSISAFFPAARNENRGQLSASRPFRAILARERTWLANRPRSSRTPSARSVAGALWRGRLVITGATRIIRSIDPGPLGRSRSSQASATFGSAIGCRHAIAVRSTRCWRKAASNSRSHLTGPCQIRDGSPFVMLGGSALERARKPPRASEERCGLGSGWCGGGGRLDPQGDVRPLQRALWVKELADLSGRDARSGRRQRRKSAASKITAGSFAARSSDTWDRASRSVREPP